jgi:nucleoside-diphosphate-sugar epimerase
MRVFVTGASGHLASAVVPELLTAGHEVLGLARSEQSAAAVTALGATAVRGDLADLDGLRRAAAAADGVIHLAFDHGLMRTGRMDEAVATELAVLGALGEALAGSGKPLVATSGVATPGAAGLPYTEHDPAAPGGRGDAEIAVLELAGRDVRACVVRLPPIVHSSLDRHGFAHTLIAAARRTGVAGYAGEGANRWPAVYTPDAARLYRLALENAAPGTRWNGVGDEGVPLRELADSIAGHLGVPAASIPQDRLRDHFGPLAMLIDRDIPATAHVTRRMLGWEPTGPGLLADLGGGHYLAEAGH